jgi:hypothetical protein
MSPRSLQLSSCDTAEKSKTLQVYYDYKQLLFFGVRRLLAQVQIKAPVCSLMHASAQCLPRN